MTPTFRLSALLALLSFPFVLVHAQASEASDSADSEVSAQTAEPSPGSTAEPDRIQVIGRAQRLYRIEDSSFATRTDTPLEEVPQSIQVLPLELIRDQAARQITDLYRSISGVSAFSYSGVTFRGFRQDEILYDGVRGDPFNGFAVPQLFNIERIEVLKGPAGAIYGSGQPGGILNYVTKKPTPMPVRRVTLGAGNQSFFSGSAEFSGPLDDDGTWQYRAGAYIDQEDTFRFVTQLENRIADVSLRRAGAFTDLTWQFTRLEQRFDGARLRGVPVTDEGRFLADRRWNHNEPTDFQDLEADVAQFRLDHEFSASTRGDLTVRWYENVELQNYHEPIRLLDLDQDGVVDFSARQFRDQRRDNESLSLTGNVVTDIKWGDVNHRVLFGGDWAELSAELSNRLLAPEELGGIVPGISLRNPVYGTVSAADYNLEQFPAAARQLEFERYGLYLQDQIELGERWNVLAGLRWDQFEDANLSAGDQFKDSGFSYRIGSTYALTPSIRAYGVYATGFVPQSPGSQDPLVGGPFDPERSRLTEVGMKSRFFSDRLAINVAAYRIVRENILQPDPAGDQGDDGLDDLIAVGEVTSEGVEIDFLGDLTPNWALNVSYAYNDTRVTEATGSISNSVGGRFVNAPEHQVGLWTRYDFPAINSAIAGGVDYVDDQISFSNQRVRSYTVFDLSWQTRFEDWLIQANVKNLFDKTYAQSGFLSRTGHFPGEPRRLYLTATLEF
ncbi:MAG: TonB-dependent siderophore receptor [Wenzhouxiangella sp.]